VERSDAGLWQKWAQSCCLARREGLHLGIRCIASILEANWVSCFLALYNWNVATPSPPLCNIPMEVSSVSET